MRAIAILGPAADAGDVRPFEAAGAPITIADAVGSADSADTALIFGGDGSIHRQLPAAAKSQVPLLCVPTGSGNDFSCALGLRTPPDALAAWRRFCTKRDNVRSIDLVQITPLDALGKRKPDVESTLYCCIAGVGLDSEVNRHANALPAWLRGHGGYALALAPALWSFRAQRVTAELDGGECFSEAAMLVAFANAPSYGHGMRMAPRARLDDGLLDLCFIRRVSKLKVLRLFPTIYFGAHLKVKEVEYRTTARLRITSETPLDIFADGDLAARTPAEISVLPKALRVIVP